MSTENEQDPLIFKIPFMQTMTTDNEFGPDLKWLESQSGMINDLYNIFSESYRQLLDKGDYPVDILKNHFEVIRALSGYQITLQEQKNRRQNSIHQETDMQEIMQQIENTIKNIRPE